MRARVAVSQMPYRYWGGLASKGFPWTEMSSCRHVWMSRASWKSSFSCINSIFLGIVPPDQCGVAVLFSLRQLMLCINPENTSGDVHWNMEGVSLRNTGIAKWTFDILWGWRGQSWAQLLHHLCTLLLIQGASHLWGKQHFGVKVMHKAEFLGGGRGGTCVHPLFLQCRCPVMLLRLLTTFMAVTMRGLSTPTQPGWTSGATVSWVQLCSRDNLKYIWSSFDSWPPPYGYFLLSSKV